MLKLLPAITGFSFLLAGCVAPEEPEPPHVAQPVVSQPTTSTAHFEDAPVPNRAVVRGTNDSVISIAH